jgi:very-short-patch-repair endonuclease
LVVAQHGVVTRAQLIGCGIGRDAIAHRIATRRLEVVHRGVYALSRELLSREGRWLAAVMAVGGDAALSHFSAAAHWRIRPGAGLPADVTSARRVRPRPAIRLHCLPLAADEVVEHAGIRVTTAARTVFDLAAFLPLAPLARALREAEFLRLADGPSLPELVDRHAGRTGAPRARALLADAWFGARTRSGLEQRFLRLLERARLPPPAVNALVEVGGERFEVDCLWRRERLIVELDALASHGTRFAFEADRRRDRLLQLAGFDVFRVTDAQIERARAALVRDLRRRLSRYA